MQQSVSAHTPPPLQNWERPFFIVWTGQAFSLFGSNLVQFALVWWITSTTGSATLLATATLVAMLPNILIGPFAGTLVDRWNRRAVMMVADGAIALVSLGLALLFLMDQAQVWMVFAVMILRSLGGTFHQPAMTASTSLMVPEKHLARVAGLNQLLQGFMSIIAPPVGALALQFLPMGSVLMIDVVTAALAVGTLALVAIPQPDRSPQGTQPTSLWQETVLGLRYVAGWPGLIGLMAMAMLVNFLVTPAFSLLPLLVTKFFNGTALQLGSMESAFGVGVIGGGILLSTWGGFQKKIYTTLLGLAGMGLGIMMIGLAPAALIGLAIAGMAVAGFMNILTNGPLQALFQVSVVPEMQGRVFALIGTLASLISPLSLLVAGPVSDVLGIRTWYWIAGSACLLAAVISLFVPAIMQIEEQGKAIRAARQEPLEEPMPSPLADA